MPKLTRREPLLFDRSRINHGKSDTTERIRENAIAGPRRALLVPRSHIRSHMLNMLPRHALSSGRRTGLGATRGFTAGCQASVHPDRLSKRAAIQIAISSTSGSAENASLVVVFVIFLQHHAVRDGTWFGSQIATVRCQPLALPTPGGQGSAPMRQLTVGFPGSSGGGPAGPLQGRGHRAAPPASTGLPTAPTSNAALHRSARGL